MTNDNNNTPGERAVKARFVVAGKDIADFIKTLKYVKQFTNEVRVHASSQQGLEARTYNPSHVSMTAIKFDRYFFTHYEVKEDFDFAFNIDRIVKFLNTFVKSSQVTIEIAYETREFRYATGTGSDTVWHTSEVTGDIMMMTDGTITYHTELIENVEAIDVPKMPTFEERYSFEANPAIIIDVIKSTAQPRVIAIYIGPGARQGQDDEIIIMGMTSDNDYLPSTMRSFGWVKPYTFRTLQTFSSDLIQPCIENIPTQDIIYIVLGGSDMGAPGFYPPYLLCIRNSHTFIHIETFMAPRVERKVTAPDEIERFQRALHEAEYGKERGEQIMYALLPAKDLYNVLNNLWVAKGGEYTIFMSQRRPGIVGFGYKSMKDIRIGHALIDAGAKINIAVDSVQFILDENDSDLLLKTLREIGKDKQAYVTFRLSKDERYILDMTMDGAPIHEFGVDMTTGKDLADAHDRIFKRLGELEIIMVHAPKDMVGKVLPSTRMVDLHEHNVAVAYKYQQGQAYLIGYGEHTSYFVVAPVNGKAGLQSYSEVRADNLYLALYTIPKSTAVTIVTVRDHPFFITFSLKFGGSMAEVHHAIAPVIREEPRENERAEEWFCRLEGKEFVPTEVPAEEKAEVRAEVEEVAEEEEPPAVQPTEGLTPGGKNQRMREYIAAIAQMTNKLNDYIQAAKQYPTREMEQQIKQGETWVRESVKDALDYIDGDITYDTMIELRGLIKIAAPEFTHIIYEKIEQYYPQERPIVPQAAPPAVMLEPVKPSVKLIEAFFVGTANEWAMVDGKWYVVWSARRPTESIEELVTDEGTISNLEKFKLMEGTRVHSVIDRRREGTIIFNGELRMFMVRTDDGKTVALRPPGSRGIVHWIKIEEVLPPKPPMKPPEAPPAVLPPVPPAPPPTVIPPVIVKPAIEGHLELLRLPPQYLARMYYYWFKMVHGDTALPEKPSEDEMAQWAETARAMLKSDDESLREFQRFARIWAVWIYHPRDYTAEQLFRMGSDFQAFRVKEAVDGILQRIAVAEMAKAPPPIVPPAAPPVPVPPAVPPVPLTPEERRERYICAYFSGADVPGYALREIQAPVMNIAMTFSERCLDVHFKSWDEIKEDMVVGYQEYTSPLGKPRYSPHGYRVESVHAGTAMLVRVDQQEIAGRRVVLVINYLQQITRKPYHLVNTDRQVIRVAVMDRQPVPLSLLMQYGLTEGEYIRLFRAEIPCGDKATYPLVLSDIPGVPPAVVPTVAPLPKPPEVLPPLPPKVLTMEERIGILGYPAVLHPFQKEAIETFLKTGRGVIQLPTGLGKTECAIGIWSLLDRPRVIFVAPTQALVINIKQRLDQYTIPRVTYWYADFKDATGDILVTTYASARVHPELLAGREMIVCDEVHHMKGDTTAMALLPVIAKMRYALGISATAVRDPQRPHPDEQRIFDVMPLIYSKLPSEVREYMARVIIHLAAVAPVGSDLFIWEDLHQRRTNIHSKLRSYGIYRFDKLNMVAKTHPNNDVKKLALGALKLTTAIGNMNETLPDKISKICTIVQQYPKGEKILITMGRIDGAEMVHNALEEMGYRSFLFTSETVKGKGVKEKVLSRFGIDYDIIASVSQLREGINVPELKVIIVSATRGSMEGKLPILLDMIQTIGRVTRKTDRDAHVYVIFNKLAAKDVEMARIVMREFGTYGEITFEGGAEEVLGVGVPMEEPIIEVPPPVVVEVPPPPSLPKPIPRLFPADIAELIDFTIAHRDFNSFRAALAHEDNVSPGTMKRVEGMIRTMRDVTGRPYTLEMFYAEVKAGLVKPPPPPVIVGREPMEKELEEQIAEVESLSLQSLALLVQMRYDDPSNPIILAYSDTFWELAEERLRNARIQISRRGAEFLIPTKLPPLVPTEEIERTILPDEELIPWFKEIGLDLPDQDIPYKRYRPLAPRGMTRIENNVGPIQIYPRDGVWYMSKSIAEAMLSPLVFSLPFTAENLNRILTDFNERKLSKSLAKHWTIHEKWLKEEAHKKEKLYARDESREDYLYKLLAILKKVGR